MHWIWKALIILSLVMNLVAFAGEVVIVDEALKGAVAQNAALMGISKDQQMLRREVGELRQLCEAD